MSKLTNYLFFSKGYHCAKLPIQQQQDRSYIYHFCLALALLNPFFLSSPSFFLVQRLLFQPSIWVVAIKLMPPEKFVRYGSEKKVEISGGGGIRTADPSVHPSSWSPTLYPLNHGDPLSYKLFVSRGRLAQWGEHPPSNPAIRV